MAASGIVLRTLMNAFHIPVIVMLVWLLDAFLMVLMLHLRDVKGFLVKRELRMCSHRRTNKYF